MQVQQCSRIMSFFQSCFVITLMKKKTVPGHGRVLCGVVSGTCVLPHPKGVCVRWIAASELSQCASTWVWVCPATERRPVQGGLPLYPRSARQGSSHLWPWTRASRLENHLPSFLNGSMGFVTHHSALVTVSKNLPILSEDWLYTLLSPVLGWFFFLKEKFYNHHSFFRGNNVHICFQNLQEWDFFICL